MKIMLGSLSYLPNVGGLVSYLASFGRMLLAAGHEVEILCSHRPLHELSDQEIIEGVRVRRAHSLRRSPLDAVVRPFAAATRFRRWLRRNPIGADLIVVRHLYLAAALASIPELRERTVYLIPLAAPRLIWRNRNDEGFLRSLYSAWLVPQLYVLEWYAVQKLTGVAVLSASKRDEITSYYRLRKPVSVVPPGVDTERFRPLSDAEERTSILHDLGRSEDQEKRILLTVCRLVAEKNVSLLIDALAEADDTTLQLYIVGDGPLRAELEIRARHLGLAHQVVFWGERSDPEVFYRISEMFVLGSTYEGFGHVFVESLASGTPIVGLGTAPPDVITATEEIATLETGYVLPDAKPATLASVIAHHCAGKGLATRRACRARAIEFFSWDAHLRRLGSIAGQGDV